MSICLSLACKGFLTYTWEHQYFALRRNCGKNNGERKQGIREYRFLTLTVLQPDSPGHLVGQLGQCTGLLT